MLVELSLLPVRGSAVLASALGSALTLVRESGLDHAFTPAGVRVEGDDEEVWALLWQVHEAVGEGCGLVVTEICEAVAPPARCSHELSA